MYIYTYVCIILFYCCFTAALLLLYCCFTAALPETLLPSASATSWYSTCICICISSYIYTHTHTYVIIIYIIIVIYIYYLHIYIYIYIFIYCCVTAVLLLFYRCFTAVLPETVLSLAPVSAWYAIYCKAAFLLLYYSFSVYYCFTATLFTATLLQLYFTATLLQLYFLPLLVSRKTRGSTLLPLSWTSYFTIALLFFLFLKKNTTAGLHSPAFKMDEEALPLGVALHATIGAVVKQ